MSAQPLAARRLDEAVPALDLVLDADRLRDWLAGYGEVLIRRPYLRYKPGTSCVAALELESGRAFLYGVAPAVQPKLTKLVAKAPAGSILGADPDRRLVLATLQADRDLPAVRDLPRAVAALGLDHRTDDPKSAAEAGERVQVLVHKPQRRLVGLLARHGPGADPTGTDEPAMVLRAYRRPQLDAAVSRHLRAGRVDGVRTARVLDASNRHGLLVLAHLPGQPLDVLLDSGAATSDVLASTGRALARLHRAPVGGHHPGGSSAWGRSTVSTEARTTAALVSRLHPALTGRLSTVLRSLAATAPAANVHTFCHGDFSADQVVVDSAGRPGLIDWDRAGLGDPATDLAGLRAAGLSDVAMADVLDGYAEVRPLPQEPVWHLAHACLMRAADPFRSGTPGWPGLIEANLAAIEAMLTQAPAGPR